MDQAVQMLMKVYGRNRSLLSPNRLSAFIDSLSELGLGFTKPQVMRISASGGLFPFEKEHFFWR